MEMVVTTALFLGVTALSVALHLRRTPPANHTSAPAQPGTSCPRCRSAVPSGATFCPGCGVPQQIYEVVTRAVADPVATTTAGAGHAVVRADLCVGCGTCVAACPEAGALRLEGKLAVVETALCVGHGHCVEACPVGAILITTGAATHRVEVPEVRPDFQTNVEGLFIAGELGGRGLIKNAINEGRIAAENLAQSLVEADAEVGDDALLDLVIVGSGPAGLSAGLEAHRCGLRYVILEQGTLADTIRKYPRHKLLLSEPVKIPLYGELWIADGAKETLIEVWETIIANTGLEVRTGHRVESIHKQDGRFVVQTGQGAFRARRVLLAMGRRGSPRRLGVPGEELAKVFYDVCEMEAFRGRRVLVVGGGDSAVESCLGLANQPGTEVILSYRGETFRKLKERNLSKLEAAIEAGRVQVLCRSQVREIGEQAVVVEVDGEQRSLPNDDVIVRIGGDPPYEFLQRVGVRIVQKDVPLASA